MIVNCKIQEIISIEENFGATIQYKLLYYRYIKHDLLELRKFSHSPRTTLLVRPFGTETCRTRSLKCIMKMSADVSGDECPEESLFYSWHTPVREDTFQSKNGRVASGENPKKRRPIAHRAFVNVLGIVNSVQSYLDLSP